MSANFIQFFLSGSVFYGGPKVSRQFQFANGNCNFTHGNFNLLTAILICSRQFQFYSRQFQFALCNFNLLTAISIYPRQFQFAHGNFNYSNFNFTHGDFNINSRQFHNFTQGNFNFFKATLTPFFASLTTCQLYMAANSGHAPKVKKQNYQKWIVKVDLQREK